MKPKLLHYVPLVWDTRKYILSWTTKDFIYLSSKQNLEPAPCTHTRQWLTMSFARHHTEVTPQHDLSLEDGENNVQQDYINYKKNKKCNYWNCNICTWALQILSIALTFIIKSLTFASNYFFNTLVRICLGCCTYLWQKHWKHGRTKQMIKFHAKSLA